MITHATLTRLGGNHSYIEPRSISQRNIFTARKGHCSAYHPITGHVYIFGGISQKAISEVTSFNEDTREFNQLVEGRPTYASTHIHGMTKPALKKKSPNLTSDRNRNNSMLRIHD